LFGWTEESQENKDYWSPIGDLEPSLLYRLWNARKLLKEELHNFYFSPNIIRMINLRRMRWAEYVARMGKRGMHIGFCCEDQNRRDH
jgi:hypothetical protein